MNTRFAWVAAAIALSILLAGCGDGDSPGSHTSAEETGRATFTIIWPAVSRLIPNASKSIQVIVNKDALIVGRQLLARPSNGGTSTAVFNLLPTGNLTVTASAFPNADGSGVAQATATIPLVIQANKTTNFSLTMASTISQVAVNPSRPTVSVGQKLQLTVTAMDKNGRVVLLSPPKILWTSGDGTIATVDMSGNVTGVKAGSTSITAKDSESGKTGSAALTVSPAGLVSWWKADGNATDSVSGNNGTLFGNVSFGTGKVAQSFVFTGSGGGVKIPDADSLKLTHSLTLDVWVNVNSIPSRANNYGMVLFRGDDRNGLDPYFLGMQFDGKMHFGIWNSTQGVEVSAAINLNQWVHVTATLNDATGDMTLYEDGAVVAMTNTAIRPLRDLDPNQVPGIAIGNSNDPVNFNYPFDGSIDELKVFNTVVPP